MPALVFLPKALSRELQQLQSGARMNPPRAPKELLKVYDDISHWAQPKMRWLTENAKMDKPVKGSKWLVRGVSFLPANDVKKIFMKPGGGLDRARLKKFNIAPEQLETMGNMCPSATKGCMAVCLATAGQMGLPSPVGAQVKRQIVFKQNRPAFMAILVAGIARLYGQARKRRARLGIRLNVTSDLAWETFPVTIDPWMSRFLAKYGIKAKAGNYPNIMRVFKNVQFHDYTKVFGRMAAFIEGRMPRNYHLTWSLAETAANREMALAVLLSKTSTVSVPFDIVAGKMKPGETIEKKFKRFPLPKTLTFIAADGAGYTFPVTDADKHDMRPKDPKGTISGLRFKVPKPRGRKGLTVKQKMKLAGEFVVTTRGDPHPEIKVHP